MNPNQTFKHLFQGNTSAYGVYSNGQHQLIKSDLTPELIENHLQGKMSLGFIPIRQDNTCKVGALDFDDHKKGGVKKEFDYNKLIKKIKLLNLPLNVFKSRTNGAHAYLFLDKFYPAADVRHLLRKFRYALGYNESTELFPKQDTLKQNDFGSWLNLSYHGGNSRVLINHEGKELNLDEAMLYASKRVVKLDNLSPYKLLADTKFIDGTNVRLFRAKQFFKKVDPDNYENKVLELNKLYDNPLEEREINSTILKEGAKDYWENPEPEEVPKMISHDIDDFLNLPLDIPEWIVEGLIRQSTTNVICAPKGVGKSEFTLGLIWAITTGQPFLNWKINGCFPCKFIDYEMGRYDTTERLQVYQKNLGKGNRPKNFLKISHFALQDNETFLDLKTEGAQKQILDDLKLQEQQTGKKPLVVIDNLRHASNFKENSSDDFRPMGLFFRDLRKADYTTIIVDHAGKNVEAGVRGSSAKTDGSNVVLLGQTAGQKNQKCMKILFKFDKSRGLKFGESMDFVCEYDGKGNWSLAATEKELKDEELKVKIKELEPKLTQKSMAEVLGISAGKVNKLTKEMKAPKEPWAR
jgi:hypothetical protein